MTDSAPKLSDDEAVAALHQELAPMLLRLASVMLRDQELAEDAVQEAFLLMATRLSEVPETQRPGWLVRTVQLNCLNMRRTRQRQLQLRQNWLASLPSGSQLVGRDGQAARQGGTAADHLEFTEELERLYRLLSQLPEEQQLVVRMRLVEELTFQEIADRLKLPLGTVLSRMRLAVEKLRSRLA